MTQFFSTIRNFLLAIAVSLALPAVASAAAYLKYEGIDGESQSAAHYEELSATTRVADILFQLARSTGMNANRIQLHYRGQRLDGSAMLAQLPRTSMPCRIGAPVQRRMQKQREHVSFCYQKIIWTVTRDSAGRFQLVETDEDMPRRRRIGG